MASIRDLTQSNANSQEKKPSSSGTKGGSVCPSGAASAEQSTGHTEQRGKPRGFLADILGAGAKANLKDATKIRKARASTLATKQATGVTCTGFNMGLVDQVKGQDSAWEQAAAAAARLKLRLVVVGSDSDTSSSDSDGWSDDEKGKPSPPHQ